MAARQIEEARTALRRAGAKPGEPSLPICVHKPFLRHGVHMSSTTNREVCSPSRQTSVPALTAPPSVCQQTLSTDASRLHTPRLSSAASPRQCRLPLMVMHHTTGGVRDQMAIDPPPRSVPKSLAIRRIPVALVALSLAEITRSVPETSHDPEARSVRDRYFHDRVLDADPRCHLAAGTAAYLAGLRGSVPLFHAARWIVGRPSGLPGGRSLRALGAVFSQRGNFAEQFNKQTSSSARAEPKGGVAAPFVRNLTESSRSTEKMQARPHVLPLLHFLSAV